MNGESRSAAARATGQVELARDDPEARLALCREIYGGFTAGSRRLPYRRAALSFMHWQLSRGLLEPLDAEVPGSRWWRSVNERLLRDGCEAAAREQGFSGQRSSSTVAFWERFASRPSAQSWYRAHNASIVAAYLAHRELAESETAAERFFMNVVLLRVLYAHSLVAAPRLSLGWLAALGRPLGDPRMGMAGAFLSLSRVLPERYPAPEGVLSYVGDENSLGRLLDYGVILPRLELLYAWSAAELDQSELCGLITKGAPSYANAIETDSAWQPPNRSRMIGALRLLTRARPVLAGPEKSRLPGRCSR